MKKFPALLLFALLLLSGCVNQEPEQSQGTTQPLVTLPPAYYEENSVLETATNGAVKQFRLPDGGYSAIHCVGNGLLLSTDGDNAKLQMLTGETCIPSSSLELEQPYPGQCRGLSNGFAYFDANTGAIRYLDINLVQRHSVALSREMTSPVISPDGSQIYYCFGQEIRAIDVEKNISRLVKMQSVTKQTLLDVCFDGAVLVCSVEDEAGNRDIHYISTKDGQTITTEKGVTSLYTDKEQYLAYWVDGVVARWICGSRGGEAVNFVPLQEKIYGAPALGGAVGYEVTDSGLALYFYDLTTCRITSQVCLTGVGDPLLLQEDDRSNCVWMIVEDPSGSGKCLLRWDLATSRVNDSATYTAALYTASDPDTAALKALQKTADEMGTKYGVQIRLWESALTVTGAHTIVPEHHVSELQNMLDQLEKVLQEFPKNFVYKSIRSRLRISLVRSVDGAADGVQFWDGRNAYIALCSGSDIRREFLKGFGFVVDSHVLGNSPVYDYWDTLNPEAFLYGKPDELLLSGENRAFVDMDSMQSGTIDRSRVFWQAMEPENGELFKSETMQKKLTMLCKAIRDAWNLEKKTDIYPWEQYLETSIAPKK